jgi:hypothetical protein
MEPAKERFAAALLRFEGKAFEAAKATFPGDTNRAMLASSKWPDDPEVIEEMARLKAELGDEYFLPTRADLARALWRLSEDEKVEARERLLAYKTYADVLGFIAKPEAASTTNNNITNKVLIVPASATAEEWESRLIARQAKLIDASRS